jgi:hypothetical protein
MHSATLLAEGAHGSLSKQVIAMYGLREGKEAQMYGIGVKVWRVKPENHMPGAFSILSPFYIPSLPLFFLFLDSSSSFPFFSCLLNHAPPPQAKSSTPSAGR